MLDDESLNLLNACDDFLELWDLGVREFTPEQLQPLRAAIRAAKLRNAEVPF